MTTASAAGSEPETHATDPEGPVPRPRRPDTTAGPPDVRPRDRWIGRLLPSFVAALCRAPKPLFAPVARLAAAIHRRPGSRDMGILHGNLENVLELPATDPRHGRMAKDVTYHQAISALETVRAIFRPGSVRLDDLERLAEMLGRAERAGRGTVIATAHLGSWELVGIAVTRVATKAFYGLAKPAKIAALTVFLEQMRARMDVRVLWTGRKALLREMLQVLRRGESLAFVMDQKPEVGAGREVRFFGRPTPFVVGPAALAARTQCAVISVFCVRTAPFVYRVVCEEIYPAEHGENDEQKMTQKMAAVIERAVREAPEQWSWTYRRWRFEDASRSSPEARSPE